MFVWIALDPERGCRITRLAGRTGGGRRGRVWSGSAPGGGEPGNRLTAPRWPNMGYGGNALLAGVGVFGEPDRVAEVGVAFQEGDAGRLGGVGAGVLEHVQAVADVDGVDQPVADDRVAPEHHLVRPAAERRVLQGHAGQRVREEEAGLGGPGRVGQVDGLDPAGVPVDEGQVWQRGGVVGGVAGELLGCRVVAGAAAERLLVFGDLVLADDHRVRGVGDVDDPGPSPRAAKARVGERAVDLVGGEGVVRARYGDRRVPVGAGLEAVGRDGGRVRWCLLPYRPVRRAGDQVVVEVYH